MYKVENILTPDEVVKLKRVYDEIEPTHAHQDFNLFDVIRKDVPSHYLRHDPVFKKLLNYGNLPVKAFYFLRYDVDSFTRVHQDDNSAMTIVTLVESEELVGGDPICYLPYMKDSRPAYKYAKRSKKEEETRPIGKHIIPEVIPVQQGQSIIYGPRLDHGVSRVNSGHRIVLISWFLKEK